MQIGEGESTSRRHVSSEGGSFLVMADRPVQGTPAGHHTGSREFAGPQHPYRPARSDIAHCTADNYPRLSTASRASGQHPAPRPESHTAVHMARRRSLPASALLSSQRLPPPSPHPLGPSPSPWSERPLPMASHPPWRLPGRRRATLPAVAEKQRPVMRKRRPGRAGTTSYGRAASCRVSRPLQRAAWQLANAGEGGFVGYWPMLGASGLASRDVSSGRFVHVSLHRPAGNLDEAISEGVEGLRRHTRGDPSTTPSPGMPSSDRHNEPDCLSSRIFPGFVGIFARSADLLCILLLLQSRSLP
jgi:hypothetical protein